MPVVATGHRQLLLHLSGSHSQVSLKFVLAAVLLLPRRCAAPYGMTFGNADAARRTGEHAGVQF